MKKEYDIQELFDIKQKFMREVPHPTLINKYFKMTSDKSVKPLTLNVEYLNKELQELELGDFLNRYIAVLMPLKLKLSNATTIELLNLQLMGLFKLQNNLLYKLDSYLPQTLVFPADLKVSDPIDAHEILKALKSLNLQEKEIKGYLCEKLSMKTFEKSDMILSFMRAKKIIENGR